MPEEPKPKCPKCETELVLVEGKLPPRCGKCDFLLVGHSDFQDWFDVAIKKSAKKKSPSTDTGNDSPFANLGKIFN